MDIIWLIPPFKKKITSCVFVSEENFSVKETLLGWLNSFSVTHETQVPFSNSSIKLDFLLPDVRIGIMIPNWKRPIAVSVLNKAIQAQQNLNLEKVIIVSKSISFHAAETLRRIDYPIEVIDEYSLTEIFTLLCNSPDGSYLSANNQVFHA